jgi:hypothetical protein
MFHLKRGRFVWILSCCLLALMVLSVGTVMAAAKETIPGAGTAETKDSAGKADEEQTISGTVTVAAKDNAGKATAVKIVTDQGDYAVANNPAAQELLKLLDAEVDVTGKVVVKDGKKTITISEFDVVAE